MSVFDYTNEEKLYKYIDQALNIGKNTSDGHISRHSQFEWMKDIHQSEKQQVLNAVKTFLRNGGYVNGVNDEIYINPKGKEVLKAGGIKKYLEKLEREAKGSKRADNTVLWAAVITAVATSILAILTAIQVYIMLSK